MKSVTGILKLVMRSKRNLPMVFFGKIWTQKKMNGIEDCKKNVRFFTIIKILLVYSGILKTLNVLCKADVLWQKPKIRLSLCNIRIRSCLELKWLFKEETKVFTPWKMENLKLIKDTIITNGDNKSVTNLRPITCLKRV